MYRSIVMNSLLSLHAAYQNQANIYDEVKNFVKQQYHSPNFGKLMEWLQDSMQMQQCTHIDEAITTLMLITEDYNLILEATITRNKRVISDMKKRRKV